MSRLWLATTLSLAIFVPAVSAAIDDEEPAVAGRKLSDWVKMLKTDKDEAHRRAALTALQIIGKRLETSKAVPPIVEAARNDESEAVRKAATQTLGEVALAAHDASDPRKGTSKKMAEVAKETLKQAVEGLIEELKVDVSAEVRQTAAVALGRLGVDARTAVEALTNALKDKSDSVRAASAEALGRIGPEAKSAATPLMEALRDKKADRFLRVYAAFALGRIKPDTPDAAAEALAEALGDAEAPAEVRKACADALGQLGAAGEAAVPALAAALKEKQNLEVRRACANALGQLGPAAAKALPELRQALKDDDKYVRIHSLHALGGIGKDAADALPEIIRCVKEDSVTEVRVAAIETVGSIGVKAPDAIDALTTSSRSPQTAVREAAVEALKKLQGE